MNEVEEVKSRLDIGDVIGGYIQLKPAGRNLKALSPFKAEKTASFMVSPEKGIWHDFSSGEGGDVISFVMKMEGLSFPEALEMLAKRAGVTLTPRGRSDGVDATSRQKLYDVLEQAVKYYHLCLSRNKTALAYLTQARGIKAETIRAFRLGYAPDQWEGLTQYLLKRDFTQDQIKKAGLGAQKSGRDNIYDIFRGRIMFPIYDSQNRAIGFSARVLTPDAQAAKYINTGSTPIYNKSTAIYGLKQAKDAIRQSASVLMVEGNMDAVMLHQEGIKHVVAVSGTALTTQQLKSLSYLTDEILICFDSDEAGMNATKRAIETAAEVGLSLKVVSLPDGKDPDELIRENKKLFNQSLANAQPGADYIFELATAQFPPGKGENKKKFSDYVVPLLNKMDDSIEQDHYVKKLAQVLSVEESSVRTKLWANQSKPSSTLQSTASTQTNESTEGREIDTPPPSRQSHLENALLELLLAYPATRAALEDLELRLLSRPNTPIFRALVAQPKATLDQLARILPDLANHVKILALRGEQTYEHEADQARLLEAYTQIHHLRDLQRQSARSQLTRLLREAERTGDTTTRDQILTRIQTTLNEDI